MRLLVGFITLALVTSASLATAQVNVEPLRKKLRKGGVSGNVDASFVVRTGNVEGLVAGGGAQVGLANPTHLLFGAGRFDYSRLENALQLERTFLHARYNLTFVRQLLYGELFVQHQSDTTVLLRRRVLVGTGPRIAFVNDADKSIVTGLSIMLERESWKVPEGAPDDPETLYVRASSYASITLTPDNRITLSLLGMFQPRVTRFADRRFLFEGLFEVKIVKGFSVRITSTVRYDSDPITGVRKTDAEVRNAFAWTYH